MDIQLIQGEFSTEDTLYLVTQMIHTKIKYHENKIMRDSSEEDIKYRESKIKRLQKDLYDLRTGAASEGRNLRIDAIIKIE
jgi:hypothetical protein